MRAAVLMTLPLLLSLLCYALLYDREADRAEKPFIAHFAEFFGDLGDTFGWGEDSQ